MLILFGAIAGYIPAKRAASIKPIVALEMNSQVIFDFDTWQEIFGSIAKNKTRTNYSVGVLWGIFIYITLSGAAKGLDNGFERESEDMAMNSMFVWPQRTSVPYAGLRWEDILVLPFLMLKN